MLRIYFTYYPVTESRAFARTRGSGERRQESNRKQHRPCVRETWNRELDTPGHIGWKRAKGQSYTSSFSFVASAGQGSPLRIRHTGPAPPPAPVGVPFRAGAAVSWSLLRRSRGPRLPSRCCASAPSVSCPAAGRGVQSRGTHHDSPTPCRSRRPRPQGQFSLSRFRWAHASQGCHSGHCPPVATLPLRAQSTRCRSGTPARPSAPVPQPSSQTSLMRALTWQALKFLPAQEVCSLG